MKTLKYHVIGSTDDNYAKYLGVAFYSILKNTSQKEAIKFYCIDGGISKENIDFINNAVKKLASAPVEFIKVDQSKYADLKTIKHITTAAYYRISIPELIDPEVDTMLYVDCDMLVMDDITKLWAINLENLYLAAVENASSRTHLKTGLEQQDYFNSGLLLMNLKEWRKNNLSKKIIEFKKDHPEKTSTNDQCAINYVVDGKWFKLPLKWNHQTGMYRNTSMKNRFSKKELNEALINPSIIHYIGIDKPWKKYCYHPWQKQYVEIAKELGLNIETATRLELAVKSLVSFSMFKKYIRSRYRVISLTRRL